MPNMFVVSSCESSLRVMNMVDQGFLMYFSDVTVAYYSYFNG